MATTKKKRVRSHDVRVPVTPQELKAWKAWAKPEALATKIRGLVEKAQQRAAAAALEKAMR